MTNEKTCDIILKRCESGTQKWLVGQAVKTSASHAENMGSIPVRVTKHKKAPHQVVLFYFLVFGDSYTHRNSAHKAFSLPLTVVRICTHFSFCNSSSAHGFAFAARRSASSLARRRACKYSPKAKFPYLRHTPRCQNIKFIVEKP